MWSYDFFNQYSALINEFNIDNDKVGQQKKKIFVSMWYGEENDGTKQEQLNLYDKYFRGAIEEKGIYKVISTKIKDNDKDIDIDFRLKYLLETTIADKTRKGDISFDIFRKIIEASLIICDVTPIGKIEKKEKPVFCDNVMAELGLSLAWKLPEQVIILFNRENSFKFSLNELPFNIKGYFVYKLGFNNRKFKIELLKIIKGRFKDIDEKKSIFIKNIKSKLDQNSIRALAGRNGLMFFDQKVDVHTIRYLLSLGIIRTEQFPSRPISFGYCLTEIGKVVLTQLGIQLFPEEFIDFYLVRYWEGYSAAKGYASHNFEEKQKAFEKAYGIKNWKDSLRIFVKQIPQEVKKVIEDVPAVKRGLEERSKEKQNGYSHDLEIFPHFVDSYPFELVNSTVSKWLKLTHNKKKN